MNAKEVYESFAVTNINEFFICDDIFWFAAAC